MVMLDVESTPGVTRGLGRNGAPETVVLFSLPEPQLPMASRCDDGLESCMVCEAEHPLQGSCKNFLSTLTTANKSLPWSR